MGIGKHGSAGLRAGTTQHEPGKVVECLFSRVLVLVLVGRQLRLEVLVDDEVNDGLTDAPVGGGHPAPKPANSLEEKATQLNCRCSWPRAWMWHGSIITY